MNLITLSSNFITRFPWYFKAVFADSFWRTFFGTQKMHISEYACKTCLKKLGVLLKSRATFEKFLAACQLFLNTGLPQFFSKFFWQLLFKNVNILTKTKKCLLCWLLWTDKKRTDWQKSDKWCLIFQKSKSYNILNTDIHIDEDLEFIIHVSSVSN